MMRFLFLSFVVPFLLFSCQKTDLTDGEVEIYGLETFAWRGPGICAVDPNSAVLKSTPLATNDGIVSYDLSSYILEFQGVSAQNIRNLSPRSPFAVTVNREIIFIGVCMQMIMSSSCSESITLENLVHGPNRAQLNLGYPGPLAGVPIDDQRKNKTLLRALEKQGKLRR